MYMTRLALSLPLLLGSAPLPAFAASASSAETTPGASLLRVTAPFDFDMMSLGQAAGSA